jgi:hypothetical protein
MYKVGLAWIVLQGRIPMEALFCFFIYFSEKMKGGLHAMMLGLGDHHGSFRGMMRFISLSPP